MGEIRVGNRTVFSQSGVENSVLSAKNIKIDELLSLTNAGNIITTENYPAITDSVTLSPSYETTVSAGAVISNFRVCFQKGDGITASSDRVTINRAGTYLAMQVFMFNTSSQGTNGDTRIRLNGVDIVAGYSYANDYATWEKSTGVMVVYCNVDDYIDVKAQSVQYIWGSAAGYTHSQFVVARIGT